jgi:hypothetical protein
MSDQESFMSHLVELRQRLVRAVGAVLALFVIFIFWPGSSAIYDFLAAPLMSALPEGAKMMTIECGMRFLTDYLDGDKYFKVEHTNHNLDRARCQLALAKDMIKHFDEMNEIVKKYL